MGTDFDHPHATIAQSLGPVTKLLARGIGLVFGGHRNGTHSLLGLALFTAGTWFRVRLGGWYTGVWSGFLLAVGSAALHLKFTKGSAIVHTLVCLVGSVLLVLSATKWQVPFDLLTWGVGIGYFSHAIVPTDALTKEGCPWFWPFWKYRFHLANLTTDHLGENAVVFPLLLVTLLGIIRLATGYLTDPTTLLGVGHTGAAHHSAFLIWWHTTLTTPVSADNHGAKPLAEAPTWTPCPSPA